MAETPKSDHGSNTEQDTTRSVLTNLAKVALLVGVIYFFVWPLIQEFPQAWNSIRNLNPWLGLLAVVVDGLSWLAYAYMLQVLISRHRRPTLGIAFGTVVASRGLTRILPAGGAGTIAVEYKLLHQTGVPNDEVAYAVSAQGVVAALALNVMMVSALVVAVFTTGFRFEFVTAGVFALLVVIGIAVVTTVLVRYTDRTARTVTKVLGIIPNVNGSKGGDLVTSVGAKVQALLTDRPLLVRLFLSAVINWLLGALSVWVTLLALGQQSRFLGAFVAFAGANVVSAIPISPGGLGIFEAAMTATLGLFGVPRAMAVAATVTFRLIDLWLPIPLGALSYLLVNRLTSRDHVTVDRR